MSQLRHVTAATDGSCIIKRTPVVPNRSTHQEDDGGVPDHGDGRGQFSPVAPAIRAGGPVRVGHQAELLEAPLCRRPDRGLVQAAQAAVQAEIYGITYPKTLNNARALNNFAHRRNSNNYRANGPIGSQYSIKIAR